MKSGCRTLFYIILGLCLGNHCISSQAHAGWEQDGELLNVDGNLNALYPSITVAEGVPYVAWHELAGNSFQQVYVKRYNGASWEQLGGGLKFDDNEYVPWSGVDIVVDNSTPFVAWTEFSQIYVKYYNGADWIQLGGSLNVDSNQYGYDPSIAIRGGTPWVAWSERSGGGVTPKYIYVKRYNGSTWIMDDGKLDYNGARRPSLAFVGNTPFVAWDEDEEHIHVKYFNGLHWTQIGGDLKVNTGIARGPRLRVSNSTPYVVWKESQNIYTKYYNGTEWVQIGGSVANIDTNFIIKMGFGIYNTTPFVVFNQGYYLHVKYFTGAAWDNLGGVLNNDQQKYAGYPSLAMDGDVPYVAWSEDVLINVNSNYHVYVKHFVTPTSTPTASMTATISPTPTMRFTKTITPTATVTPTITPLSLSQDDLVAYPQPAKRQLHLVYRVRGSALVQVDLYNSRAERVLSFAEQPYHDGGIAHTVINIGKVAPGMYFLRCRVEDQLGQRSINKRIAVIR